MPDDHRSAVHASQNASECSDADGVDQDIKARPRG
jgi:hypothetical protein